MKAFDISGQTQQELQTQAAKVLADNNIGGRTKPAPRLYPHQWLWDSCFIGIGTRHLDPAQAASEITSLFKGQWKNGMIPNVIFSTDVDYHAGPDLWRTDKVAVAPDDVLTSGVTQPPMIAEATVRVGEKLTDAAKQAFYKEVFPGLVKFHEWLYTERDPDRSGLVVLLHGWECGLDDTPPWSVIMQDAAPPKVKELRRSDRLDELDSERPDFKHAAKEVRPSNADFFTSYHLQKEIQKYDYDLGRIIAENKDIPLVQDVLYNSILIRANQRLEDIARELGEELPKELRTAIEKAPKALETLYEDGKYWSRDYRTGALLKHDGICSLMPLYSGTISEEHAEAIIEKAISDEYWPNYGIATVPTDSPFYNELRFWQGPVWVNVSWLMAQGFAQYGRDDLRLALYRSLLAMVAEAGGDYEYFSARTAKGAGTNSFSWTAALVIDMLEDLGR